MRHLKATLFIAMLAASATAAAQTRAPVYDSAGEAVLQQILDQVVGSRYSTDTRWRNSNQQEMFRRADLNRDGYLTRAEVDAYRARMRYDRDDRYDRRNRNERGIPVREVDNNGDGYISRNEARQFVRKVQRQGLDDYYDRSEHRGRYNR